MARVDGYRLGHVVYGGTSLRREPIVFDNFLYLRCLQLGLMVHSVHVAFGCVVSAPSLWGARIFNDGEKHTHAEKAAVSICPAMFPVDIFSK